MLTYITSTEKSGILRKTLSMLGKILGSPSGPFHAIIGAFQETSNRYAPGKGSFSLVIAQIFKVLQIIRSRRLRTARTV
ncbi:MAG: hypothetical protein ACRD5J_17920, partial [Nitrososphaeraceae archaeon]